MDFMVSKTSAQDSTRSWAESSTPNSTSSMSESESSPRPSPFTSESKSETKTMNLRTGDKTGLEYYNTVADTTKKKTMYSKLTVISLSGCS